MQSTLLNHYTNNEDVNFYEYQISFTNEIIPGEQILVGFDYSNRNIIAELRGEQIVVGIMPYTDPDIPFRLILTVEAQVEVEEGEEEEEAYIPVTSYIPYEVYFNFSETTNEYTQTLINPFIKSIDKPGIDVIHETVILDTDMFVLVYYSDADKVTIEITNEFSVLVYSNYFGRPNDTLGMYLPEGLYNIQVIAYNDPLVFSTYNGEVLVEGSDKEVYIENYVNTNTIYNPTVILDILPIITYTNIIIINSNTVEFIYQTVNADYVDITTNFGQNYNNISPNGVIQFNNLTVNTLYEITIIARDTNSNFDTRDLNFTIIVNIVNNTKGILGLKRGKEL